MLLTSGGEMKNLKGGKVWFLEMVYLKHRTPWEGFDQFRRIVDEFIIFGTESLVDDGGET
jgi:hypothetical protein